MTRWYVANYWSLRALKANTEKVMYRHRTLLVPSKMAREASELELRWLWGDR